jgi:hypothetical protein
LHIPFPIFPISSSSLTGGFSVIRGAEASEFEPGSLAAPASAGRSPAAEESAFAADDADADLCPELADFALFAVFDRFSDFDAFDFFDPFDDDRDSFDFFFPTRDDDDEFFFSRFFRDFLGISAAAISRIRRCWIVPISSSGGRLSRSIS